MGRGLVYLPAIHDGKSLVPAAAPRVVEADGSVTVLSGTSAPEALVVTATTPEQTSVDTKATTPVSYLAKDKAYDLFAWKRGDWVRVDGVERAGGDALAVAPLPTDGLYWMVERGSRKLERVFTIRGGRQRFW